MIGEFRASLDGIRSHPEHMPWMFWSYVQLDRPHQEGARTQLGRLFGEERFHGATLLEWLDFAASGFAPLVQRLVHEGSRDVRFEIPAPRSCAASFLAAWLWQCMCNRHERYALADLHVALGLGHQRALVMEWDFRSRPMGRYIQIVDASLEMGRFNTHADLSGFPQLPEHCQWPPLRSDSLEL